MAGEDPQQSDHQTISPTSSTQLHEDPQQGDHQTIPPTSSSQLHVPLVTSDCKPKVGQAFDSLSDAFEFYNKYARECGFSVRNGSSKKRKGGDEIYWKEYVCFKQGTSSMVTDNEKTRKRGILRENCKAKLSVVKGKIGSTYTVSHFVEGHSHSLTSPDKVHMLNSHRQVSEGNKSLLQLLSLAAVPTNKHISVLDIQARGIENIGCTERDIRNFERDMKQKLKGHDADLLNEHFLLEQKKNPSFTFKIVADREDKLTHCFWADVTSRRAFELYGDVVVFDTTYNTNRYGMIFAPLMGVNNHWQTVIFGCAFLSDETTESFNWLFEEWMKAMPRGPPKMIITDQDPAMEKAIARAFPTTLHRNCIWHILDKFSFKLGAVTYKDYYDEFHNCIWNSETTEEFDTKWNNVIEKSNLHENSWLKTMYERRFMWVPVYVNHVFSAGMSSSQRAESSHAFFKKYISKNNSLMDFIVRFERALSRQRHKELDADHKDVNEKPVLKTPMLIERQMVEIYTRTIFFKFQDELWESMVYTVFAISENGNNCIYRVKRADKDTLKFRRVLYDRALDLLNCSCRKFESEGIVCRHILAYYKFKQIQYLSDYFILRRWTKVVRSVEILDHNGNKVLQDCGSSLIIRRNTLSQIASSIIDDASLTEEATELLKKHLLSAKDFISVTMQNRGEEVLSDNIIIGQHIFNEPDAVRAKGCGKRHKGAKDRDEDEEGEGRLCHGCGKRGVSHDKRNCPILNSRYETI